MKIIFSLLILAVITHTKAQVKRFGQRISISSERKNWDDAKADCEAKDSTLVTIKSIQENNIVRRKINQAGKANKQVWIGLNDKTEEGRYQWADTSSYVNFLNLDIELPRREGQDCVIMRPGLKTWNDISCARLRYYVCLENETPNAVW